MFFTNFKDIFTVSVPYLPNSLKLLSHLFTKPDRKGEENKILKKSGKGPEKERLITKYI